MNIVLTDQIWPISPEQPCGADLEYDTAFTALQQAATGRREQQFGDNLIPAVAPDWQHVEALAVELLNRTVDLRVIALLTLAWTEMSGLAGYAKGLSLVACVLDQYWEHVHPQLESGGEFDPLPRLNAIAALTDQQALGRNARSATLLHWRFGPLSLRDAAAILDRKQSAIVNGFPAGGASLHAELQTTLKSAHEACTVVQQLLDAIDRIHQRIAVNLSSSWVPDPIAVEGPLRVVYQEIREHPLITPSACGGESPPPASAIATSTAPEHIAGAHEASAGTMSIRTRNDVLLALENACVYLERAEPGHPAPLLLRRAQRLMHMNFYEIVRDMAPAALSQLDVLAGQPEQPSAIATH
ncbi:type VI secretion system protein TssA [Paraburkholderia caffeinilytica]|uniref:type VI secretion system protein TssA n=1 Tax=Paraburkholderia caffeinilytica TaxID=1761016 RepID=UPI0038B974AF